jgi:hypothetical protein
MITRKMPELAGISDVALELGKSKQWVLQVLRTHRGGPEPVAILAAGPVHVKVDLLGFVHDPDHKPVKPRTYQPYGVDTPYPPGVWPDEWKVVGRREIALMLTERAGKPVSGQRAATRMTHPEAPDPVAVLALGRIWLESAARAHLFKDRTSASPTYDVDIDAAKAMYESPDQPNVSQVAATFGVPRDVMRERLAEVVTVRTADLRRPHLDIEDSEIQQILDALEEPGATPNSVSGRFGRSVMTVQRIQLRHERDLAAAEQAAGQEQQE